MNILFLTKGAKGGADMSLLPILKHTIKSHNIFVVCSANYGFQETLEQENIPHIIINMPTHNCIEQNNIKGIIRYPDRNLRAIIKFPFAVKKLVKIAKEFNADLIYTNDGTLEEGYYTAKIIGVPHIWHLREFQDLDFNLKIFFGMNRFKRLLKKNDYNIAITKAIFNHFNLSNNNSTILYDGVRSINQYISNIYISKENYFLYMGKITEGKGCYDLLEAFNYFYKRNKSYKLVMLGEFTDYSFKKKVLDFIKTNNLSEVVNVKGFVNNVDIIAIKAKAVIVPSKFEALGRVTAEAMFNRTLVIGRNTAGTKEQMDNAKELEGEDVCIRFTSCQELVFSLFEVANMTENEYRKKVEKAFNAVCKYHSNENFCIGIDKIINKLLDEK